MKKNIFVALDYNSLEKALDTTSKLKDHIAGIKIGTELYAICGTTGLKKFKELGVEIFLDLKLHDIPNTVKKSIQGLSSLPIKMLTVHTSGGIDMMKAAMEAVSGTKIKVFGVTALTSLSDDETNEIFQRTSSEQVNAMLDLAESAGIDGIVCSPHELELVKKRGTLLSITPGIRLQDSNDDQKRFMTPKEAINLGADYLVIGRPITQSDNILGSLEGIYNKIYNS